MASVDLSGKWTGMKGGDAVVCKDVQLDTRTDGSPCVTYLWRTADGKTGGASCGDLDFFLRNYTKVAVPPIDYSLVYIGLSAIGRKPRGRLADFSDAQVLIDRGVGDLIRLADGADRNAAIAALLGQLTA